MKIKIYFLAILGIDYGAKKIGLAISDEQNKMALPLKVLFGQTKEEIKKQLQEIGQTHQVEKIVVGVPVSFQNGKANTFWRQKVLQNAQMKEVLEFIQWLKDNFDLPIEIEDERLSTKLANGLRQDLVKKGPDDAVAAMLILQVYLDRNLKSQKSNLKTTS